ncbi:MAG: glycosyltransferase family 4 protein [Bryobacteraceae bacterium]|nr:glycosyltransferase family 4 protein [Bryobacteraceae bacterium]
MKPLGYLLSEYPAINHTYLANEVAALRAGGIDVRVISIGTARVQHLGPEDYKEAAATLYVNGAGWRGFAKAHLRRSVIRPSRYLRGMEAAVRLGGGCIGETARWLRWFAQAVVAGEMALRLGVGHVHATYCSSVALLVGEVTGLEVSQSIHGSGEFENPVTFRLREKIRAAKFVRAISRYGMSQLMKHADPEDWGKIDLAPLGVNLERFGCHRRDKHRPFRLLTVGQLAPAKGQLVLLEAMEQLVAQGLDVELRIVGDGPLRAALEARAPQGCVLFDGYRHNDEVVRMYAEADAFVLPSFAEGIPVVLMEAMAAGLPCVASRITGIPELIEDGVSGVLVPPADVGALTAAVRRLATDREWADRLGEEGRRRVRAEYDLRRNGEALVEVFRRRVTTI